MNANAPNPTVRLIKLHEVESRVGMKKSSIYAAVKELSFPAPVRLSRRSVAWSSAAVDAWIAARIEASEGV